MRVNHLRIDRLQSYAFVLLVALAACLDPAPPPGPPMTSTASAEILQACLDNCDCPQPGGYCQNRVCVGDFGPFAPCYCAAQSCATGQVCDLIGDTGGGFCSSTCDSDCDCEYGSVCNSGQCQPDFGPFAPCYCAARDCFNPGQSCSNGFCVGGSGGGGGGGGGPSPESPNQ